MCCGINNEGKDQRNEEKIKDLSLSFGAALRFSHLSLDFFLARMFHNLKIPVTRGFSVQDLKFYNYYIS